MDESRSRLEREDLREEVRQIWDAQAEWWDDKIGDGNDFQRELVEPATERLIGDVAGATVLDVACGGRRFGRRMAELGAHVVGIDISESFIRRSKRVSRPPRWSAWSITWSMRPTARRCCCLERPGLMAPLPRWRSWIWRHRASLEAVAGHPRRVRLVCFSPCFTLVSRPLAWLASRESVEDETGIKRARA